jgi:hypothetical protein
VMYDRSIAVVRRIAVRKCCAVTLGITNRLPLHVWRRKIHYWSVSTQRNSLASGSDSTQPGRRAARARGRNVPSIKP